MTAQPEAPTAPMTLTEFDDLSTPPATTEPQFHPYPYTTTPNHGTLVAGFRALQPDVRFLVDPRKPIMSTEDAAGQGIHGTPLAILRAGGLQGQLGYRPSKLLDDSSAHFLIIRQDDHFAVLTQVQHGHNGESRVYDVLPDKPLKLGRSALKGATRLEGAPDRLPHKIHDTHFLVRHDPETGELSVEHKRYDYDGDDTDPSKQGKFGRGFGASIVAHEVGADYEPKHKAAQQSTTEHDTKAHVPRHKKA